MQAGPRKPVPPRIKMRKGLAAGFESAAANAEREIPNPPAMAPEQIMNLRREIRIVFTQIITVEARERQHARQPRVRFKAVDTSVVA